MARGFGSSYRVWLVAATVFAAFAGIGTRLVFLHVIDREKLVAYVDRARATFHEIDARRGDILDARGGILATSRSVVILAVDPESMDPEQGAAWSAVANLLSTTVASLAETIGSRNDRVSLSPDGHGLVVRPKLEKESSAGRIQWVKLADGIEESVYRQIEALKLKGIVADRVYRRNYPHGTMASHLIGFVNKEDVPGGGIEAFANFYLRGCDGWIESEKDGHSRELAQFRTRQLAPTHGYSVVMSIDSVVQMVVEDEVARIVEEFNPDKVSIIVSEAQSGFILGLANYPTYDPNFYNKAPEANLKNIAITDLVEPGSTFKIVAAAGALDAGVVQPTTRFDCGLTEIEFEGRMRRLMPDDHKYDHPLMVSEIISHSSNRGAAQLAMQLGERRFYTYARAFGFGERLGFPYGGEVNGILADPQRWSASEITRIPAGYSVAATPLQVHYAMGVIATGGELLVPQLIREIRDAEGETVYTFGPLSNRRVVSQRAAGQVANMLRGVTQRGGTAVTADIPGYEVAGKTGTAQKIIEGRYSKTQHVGSFSGFLPASRPRIVITVIVDNGHRRDRGVSYGNVVAAPSFKRIGEQLIPYLDIKPVLPPAESRLAALELP